jgi:hypothetical protein
VAVSRCAKPDVTSLYLIGSLAVYVWQLAFAVAPRCPFPQTSGMIV